MNILKLLGINKGFTKEEELRNKAFEVRMEALRHKRPSDPTNISPDLKARLDKYEEGYSIEEVKAMNL